MAGVGSAPATLNASGATPRTSGLLNYQTACAITVNRTGYWVVQVRNNMTDTAVGAPNPSGYLRILVNGAESGTVGIDGGSNNPSHTGMLSVVWAGIAGSGTVFTCQLTGMDSGFGARNATGYIDAWFVPTPDYRI